MQSKSITEKNVLKLQGGDVRRKASDYARHLPSQNQKAHSPFHVIVKGNLPRAEGLAGGTDSTSFGIAIVLSQSTSRVRSAADIECRRTVGGTEEVTAIEGRNRFYGHASSTLLYI